MKLTWFVKNKKAKRKTKRIKLKILQSYSMEVHRTFIFKHWEVPFYGACVVETYLNFRKARWEHKKFCSHVKQFRI